MECDDQVSRHHSFTKSRYFGKKETKTETLSCLKLSSVFFSPFGLVIRICNDPMNEFYLLKGAMILRCFLAQLSNEKTPFSFSLNFGGHILYLECKCAI